MTGSAPAPDPEKGLRGIFAATLVLEAVVVLLSVLVLRSGEPTALGTGLIVGLGVLLVLAAGVQRRPWGLPVALVLQAVMIACGWLVPALGVLGVVFAAVWAFLLYLRRDVARRRARGELPGQQVRDP